MLTSPLPKPSGTTFRTSRSLRRRLSAVLDLSDEIGILSNQEITERAQEVRRALSQDPQGAARESAQVEVFALAREVATRVLGQRPFPVQILGGLVIADGGIAEMATGEGKTLAAVAPVSWWALFGNGVHVATSNEYLASRDAALLAPVYAMLDLTVGVANRSEPVPVRQAAYAASITYGTAQTFGFDYLTDNLEYRTSDMVQGPHFAAIVDEADSLLIDEARTPLIISAPDPRQRVEWSPFAAFVGMLEPEEYEFNKSEEFITLTNDGIDHAEKFFGVEKLYDHPVLVQRILTSLRAAILLTRDKDYVVAHGEVVIVDEHTGRTMPDRRFQDGLHEAVEAKENIAPKTPNVTMASTTLQSFFGMYQHLGGMTGTALTDAEELTSTYGTAVVSIPTHEKRIRADLGDLLFANSDIKFMQLAQDVSRRRDAGQPVLIGTPTVEESERVSAHLNDAGVRHEVLNAKNHTREAEVIAQAGRRGAVTVATNMAGRGVDIKLGGDPHGLAAREVGSSMIGTPEYHEALIRYETQSAGERQEVIEAGGLAVLATSRHSSRRVDNQLRGRSGRQGEPGITQFYLAGDDEIVRVFGGDQVSRVLGALSTAESGPISNPLLSKMIARSQNKVEGFHADARKSLIEFDGVYTAQRRAFYQLRDALLNLDLDTLTASFLDDAYRAVLPELLDTKKPAKLSWETINKSLAEHFPGDAPKSLVGKDYEGMRKILTKEAAADLRVRLTPLDAFGEEADESKRDIMTKILLDMIDQLWARHLTRMDSVQNAVSLRRFAQVDPKIAFASEAMELYRSFIQAFYSTALTNFWRIQLTLNQTRPETTAATVADSPELVEHSALDEPSLETPEEINRAANN